LRHFLTTRNRPFAKTGSVQTDNIREKHEEKEARCSADVSDFVSYHPGGVRTLMSTLGIDATDQVRKLLFIAKTPAFAKAGSGQTRDTLKKTTGFSSSSTLYTRRSTRRR